MNQDVINNFKTNQQKNISKRMIADIENKISYVGDILRALHLANVAQGEVIKEVLAKCFRLTGFKTKEEYLKKNLIYLVHSRWGLQGVLTHLPF